VKDRLLNTRLYRTPCLRNASAWLVFACAFITYWLTLDSGVSYWDCPEYVTCASLLEVGHPPGNPAWMLAMRIATLPFPAHMHAYVVNLCSALFMALAASLLARITYNALLFASRGHLRKGKLSPRIIKLLAVSCSICCGLCFAWCDSVWFSAVEAEVYAMSAFLSALSIWLMTLWANSRDAARRSRLIILIAYIMGLSIGVHQLNLLCLPVLAIIYVYCKKPVNCPSWKSVVALLLSFIAVAIILVGMMNGVLTWASDFELFAVNTLGMPFFSGVAAYAVATLLSMVVALISVSHRCRIATLISLAVFIWLSGLTVVNGNIAVAGIASLTVAAVAVYSRRIQWETLRNGIWITGMLLLGYSSFAIILIRGAANPPMNEGAPTDIFALSRYISREQYGSKPLLYGATPYSRPIFQEIWKQGESSPEYSRYVLKKRAPRYVRALPQARLHQRSGFMTADDSAANRKALLSNAAGYLLSDYSFSRMTTPELDMWLPRITSSSPSMLESYEAWAGMDKATMEHVEISTAIDSLGNPCGKMDASGKRTKETSHRPTYLQNLQFLASYQIGYMYFRYLLWNFAGRQNDIPSTGEIDHGNFITGFPFVDNAMLGPLELMPDNAYSDNPGRNVYYCLPLLLAIIGMVVLMKGGKRGRRVMTAVTVMFLMSGLAIVVYLNQSPGEPRERDYSFLGSFMAFTVWIAFGVWIAGKAAVEKFRQRPVRITTMTLCAFGLPALMLAENYDDHDRSGRGHTLEFASNTLAMRPEGIIFTQGDNFTFPLWYATDVEKRGKGHMVIDVSYLATPEYVINLMRQGEDRIRFTATPADIAYGAYAFTRIAKDADTTATSLHQALRELYSQKEGAPTFRHSRVTVAGLSPTDTLTVNLRDMASSGTIPFKQLMLLDIVASNSAGPDRKPIYFLSHVGRSLYSSLAKATRPFGPAEIYAPFISREEYLDRLSALADSIVNNAREGNHPSYVDPVIADMSRRHRGTLTRMAKTFLDNGMPAKASKCLSSAEKRIPFDNIPGASFTVADSTYHEGIEFAALLMRLGKETGDGKNLRHARSLLLAMKGNARQWQRYYAALPPERRTLLSNESRRLILTLPVIDSLLNACHPLNPDSSTESPTPSSTTPDRDS